MTIKSDVTRLTIQYCWCRCPVRYAIAIWVLCGKLAAQERTDVAERYADVATKEIWRQSNKSLPTLLQGRAPGMLLSRQDGDSGQYTIYLKWS